MRIIAIILCFYLCMQSCTRDDGPVGPVEVIDPNREIAQDVTLIYSDSAKAQFKIVSPRLDTYEEESKTVEEYPTGLHIEFYDEEGEVISSIQAKYAKRISADGTMDLRDSVVLVNYLGDQIVTPGIFWDELNHTLKTSKFVQLVKASSQDTFYGFGLEAKDDFSQFTITQLTGKRRYQSLTRELGLDEN